MAGIFNDHGSHALHQVHGIIGVVGTVRPRVRGLSSRRLGKGATRFHTHLRGNRILRGLVPRTFTIMHRTDGHIFNVHRFSIRLLNNVILGRHYVTRVHANRNGALATALPTCLGTLANGNIRMIAIGSCLTRHSTRGGHPLFRFLNLAINVGLPNVPTPTGHRTCTTSVACNAGGRCNFSCLHSGVTFDPRRHMRHGLRCTLISRISSVLVSRTHAPLVVSNPTRSDSRVCGHIGGVVPRLVHRRGRSSRAFRNRNRFSISRGSHRIGLARHNLILVRRLLIGRNVVSRKRSLCSPTGVVLVRRMATTLHTRTLFAHSISCVIGSNRIVVISRRANHAVRNHH